jgi:hypothetical protein
MVKYESHSETPSSDRYVIGFLPFTGRYLPEDHYTWFSDAIVPNVFKTFFRRSQMEPNQANTADLTANPTPTELFFEGSETCTRTYSKIIHFVNLAFFREFFEQIC